MEKKLELHLAELLYKTEGEDIICQGKETGKKKLRAIVELKYS